MLTEVNDWTTKIQDCHNEPKFAQKYLELMQKITNAASEIN
jgi:hypothetical protein